MNLPRDPRHQRFADLLLSGVAMPDAYLQAGFKCDRASAQANAKRLRKRPEVAAYIAAIQAKAAEASVLTVVEKREFFARIVRTPLTVIDPDNPHDPNRDLIKKLKRRYATDKESEREYCTEEFEKLDPLKAISLDNDLSGDNPEANSMQQLADAIASMGKGAGVLPTETM